jgi:hypothetical protein
MSEDTTPQVRVESAENVNVPTPFTAAHPAVIWLVAFVTVGVLFGFGWVTYAVLSADTGVDPATKGAVIQTWNNLAVAAAAVWTTSSVVSKVKGNG